MNKKRRFAATPFARVVAPRRKVPTQKPIPLNVLFGLPDDRRATIKIEAGGRRLDYDLPGTVDIVHHLPPERFSSEWVYLGPEQEQPAKLHPGALLNHIGDADLCARALELARQVVSKSGRACFNHPDAIAGTTRDRVARALTGIPGLDVPKTIRTAALTPAELGAVVKRQGLEYPLLIRVVGHHGGTNMVRVDTPRDVDEVDRLDRSVRSDLYVTEFRNFVGADGLYRKFRIVVVGDDILMRHMITAENWLVHASQFLETRTRKTANTKEVEYPMFARFDNELRERLLPMFQEIGRRLDLDYFGVDCALLESGEVVLFEANACMTILGQTQKEMNPKAVAINRVHDAVLNLLAAPSTWRHARPRAGEAKGAT
jgi:glutathione synthase/RimK-type ligase-like ATP-grasp enzyme